MGEEQSLFLFSRCISLVFTTIQKIIGSLGTKPHYAYFHCAYQNKVLE
jgi:hypothetical protein